MSQSIVLKSFADLAELFDLDRPADGTSEEPAEYGEAAAAAEPNEPLAAGDITELLAHLEEASATLATVARQDQETRALALHDLEQYDARVAAQAEAELAHAQACRLRTQAEAFAESALADEARMAAGRVACLARQVEEAAARTATERRQEIEALAARLDIDRLLAERRREEEAERTRAAEAERAQRLNEGIARARLALAAGDLQEARAVLGPLSKDNPDNAEIASLLEIIARRELGVKVDAAEEGLRTARRAYRHDPTSAVARLADLDVDGLPEPLARQVFGEWARTCSRLCRDRDLKDPLRYAPDPGCGAVLAREDEDAPYTVVSAVGMDHRLQPGTTVPEPLVRRARPLR